MIINLISPAYYIEILTFQAVHAVLREQWERELGNRSFWSLIEDHFEGDTALPLFPPHVCLPRSTHQDAR